MENARLGAFLQKSSLLRSWIVDELSKQVKDATRFDFSNEIEEGDPVADQKGQMWKTWKYGKHTRLTLHFSDGSLASKEFNRSDLIDHT